MATRLDSPVLRFFAGLTSSLLDSSVLVKDRNKATGKHDLRPERIVSFFIKHVTGLYTRKGRELSLDPKIRRVVRKHVGLHLQNLIPREGINQLPWVRYRALGFPRSPETVQGHVGSCALMAEDFGNLLGWPRRKIDYLRSILQIHEIDEIGHGDVSLFNMAQKRSPDWRPYTRDEWLAYRRRRYFIDGGQQRVADWVREYVDDPFEAVLIQSLNNEFAQAETVIARIANQIDALQAIIEAGARLMAMKKRAKTKRPKSIEDAAWNFENYRQQGAQIMEHPVMVAALIILKEECLKS